jgi:lactoylglutathione lyase
MNINHVAIWTDKLEELRDYYVKYFEGVSNKKYFNPETKFESYFISFESGSRLELMRKPGIPSNTNDTVGKQHLGFIHLSFGVKSMDLVNEKCKELSAAGYKILRGPRKTGDGDWEFETLDPDNNRIEVCARCLTTP